jgi:hypothetical protein
MTRRRGLRSVLVPALCLLSFATVAIAARGDAGSAPMATAASSAGSLSIFNSRGGEAVLSVAGLAPGRSTSGAVTIQNNGALGGAFSLASANLAETPGPGGGLLSQRLQLTVIDLGASGTVYTGPLAGLGSRDLGTFAPGEARTFSFTATLPDSGTPPSPVGGDNAYQGASLTNAYVWTATELDAPVDPPAGNPPSGDPPGGAPPELTPLQLRITLPRRQPPLREGKLVLGVWCNNACAFRASGTLARRGGQAKSKAWASLHHGGKLTLRIPRKSARKLERALRAKRGTLMKLHVVARDSLGRTATLRRTLALKRVGRGKRMTVGMAWSARR